MDFVVLIVFAIILALITVALYNLGRLQPKSRFGSKNGLIWTCILTGFIVSLLGIIIAVNVTKHGEDDLKLDEAIKETDSILVKARHHVERISVDTLDLSFMTEPMDYIKKRAYHTDISYRVDIGLSKGIYNTLESMQSKLPDTIKLCEKISKDIDDLNQAFPAACGEKIYVTNEEARDRAVSINNSIGLVMGPITILDNDMKTMMNSFQKLADEQEKPDFVEKMIKDRLETMKKMIEKFQTEISKSDETKQKWGRKIRESTTFWVTENIVKLLVNVVCIMLIIMSIISIITLYRPSLFGQKIVPSKLISILFCITAILTIISGLIVLIVSIGTVGQFDCPLKNDTFGVANFTVPLPDSNGNREFSLCATSDSTVFARIFPLINRDEISHNLKIEEYKEKMLALYIPSVTTSDLPSSFSEDLESIRKVNDKMNGLVGKNCLGDAQSTIELDCFLLQYFLKACDEYKKNINKVNKKMVNKESIFKNVLNYQYNDVVKTFEKAIDKITKNITAVDFPCESIVAGYSECAHSICKQFDSPLDTYSIYLLITILICLISLIIFASIYNSLTIINEDIKSDSKSAAITPT